jgi:hypothetical protein
MAAVAGPAWGKHTQVNENTVPDRFGSIRETPHDFDVVRVWRPGNT